MAAATRPTVPYYDRSDAGRVLAEALRPYSFDRPLILGVPRGGVVVAKEVARALEAPMDVIVTRKLGAPGQPEFAVGAVAPGGVLYLDRRSGWDERRLQTVIEREQTELRRRVELYRHTDVFPDVSDRDVIVVDDGIATGRTAFAALRAVRRAGANRVVLAVPVCPGDSVEQFGDAADEFICPCCPDDFFAVGEWYVHFDPVSDDQVLRCLGEMRRPETSGE